MPHPLKQFREENGLTQQELGKELGVSENTVWRWENGVRSPRPKLMPRIIQKTGLTPGEVLGYAKRPEAAR